MPLKPERKAQLDDYARRHGQDAAEALDDVLADYFAWEQQEQVVIVGWLPGHLTTRQT